MRYMRTTLVGLVLGLPLVMVIPAQAEQTIERTDRYHAASGHVRLNAWLQDVNHYAERHPAAFIDELEWHAGADPVLLRTWLVPDARQAADLFLACQLAALRGTDIHPLLSGIDVSGAGQWQSVLDGLKVPLSAAEMASLEKRFQSSYRRWARPAPASLRKRG